MDGVLGLGEREHEPIQWPDVSLLTQGTLQIQKGAMLPLKKQTNKQEQNFTSQKYLQIWSRI